MRRILVVIALIAFAFAGLISPVLALPSSSLVFAPGASAPRNLKVRQVTDAIVTLSWDPPDGGPKVERYRVYRMLRDTEVLLVVLSADTTTFTDDGVEPATLYAFRVAAFDRADDSSSNGPTVKVTTYAKGTGVTIPGGPDRTPPATPRKFKASAVTSQSVTLTWDASTDTGGSGVAGYRIYRGRMLAGNVEAGTTTFKDAALDPATVYTFTIESFDNAGNASTRSEEIYVTTPKGNKN